MTCPQCQQPTARLIIDKRGKACATCRGMSVAAGVQVDGSMTRHSERITSQQRKHEGDLIPPHRYDSKLKRVVPNPDFVKGYPGQLPDFFSQAELESEGYQHISTVFEHRETEKANAEATKDEGVTFKPGTPDLEA